MLAFPLQGGEPAVAAAAPAAGDSAKADNDKVLSLDAFVVDTTADTGYSAKNTLSGTGSNEPLIKIPQSISIANLDLMRDLGALGQGGLMKTLEMTTGSIVRRSYNNGDDQFLWGFRVNNSMRNGIPNGVSTPIGETYDVDRVEVVKGPAASLFGQASFIAGVINYVSRQPTKRPHYEVDVAGGSFDLVSGQIHASGPLTDGVRYRADFGGTETKGPREGTYTRDRFIGGAIDYDLPTGILKVEGNYYPTHSYHTITMLDPTNGPGNVRLLPVDENATLNEPWDRYDSTMANVSAVLITNLGNNLSSRSLIGYNDVIFDWTRDSPNGTISTATHTLGKNGLIYHDTQHNLFVQQTFLKELQTGPVHHKITLIGDSRYYVSPGPYTANFNLYPTPTSTPAYDYLAATHPVAQPGTALAPGNVKQRTRISGASIGDTASFWKDRVSLSYGVRFNDQVGVSGVPINTFTNDVNSPASLFQTTSIGSVTSKHYGVMLQPIEGLSAYYNYSEAFLFNAGNTTLPLPNGVPLVPSISSNKEIGVKGSFLNGALTLTFAHFNIEVSNVRVVSIQTATDPQPGNSKISQDGFQVNKGFDFSLIATKKFEPGSINAIVTYYHGNIVNELAQKPLGIPNNTASAWGVFAFSSSSPLAGFKFGLGSRFTGEEVAPALPITNYPQRRPSYWTSRAMAEYSFKRYNVQLNVDNLADKKYIDGLESAFWLTTDPGRSYRVTVGYSF